MDNKWEAFGYQRAVCKSMYRVEMFAPGHWYLTVFPDFGNGSFKNKILSRHDTAEEAIDDANEYIDGTQMLPQDIDAARADRAASIQYDRLEERGVDAWRGSDR